MISKDKIEKIRFLFPVFNRFVYMNTGWCSPRAQNVYEAIDKINRIELEEGVGSLKMRDIQEEIRNSLRTKIAKFLKAEDDEIAITQNTSSGINIIVTCFSFKKDDEVIISSEEHPAGIVPWLQLKNLKGISLKVVKTASPEKFLSSIRDAINKKTKLIMLSHISCMTGFRFPIEEICKIANEKGIPTLIDGAQSSGQINVDVHKLGCDFYAIPGQKWMLGPESTGALYIRKDWLPKIQSINAGYRSIKKFDFVKPYMELHTSAKRFEMFDTNAGLMKGLDEGISLLMESGIEEIEETIKSKTKALIEELSKIKNIDILTPSNYSKYPDSGLLSIQLNDIDAAIAVKKLYEKFNIIARHFRTGNILRFSVNFFNNDNDSTKVIEAVSQIASSSL
ncbi:MAG: aminotransferase class V-fold PLP-dependent enzyme [Candidatus Schekmanbacteria bacterium]|nr:MAG: aminotransferase class V-fold PLP-dependent enzyme [Candidatus Schekmanbacteria bacterium]